MMKTILKAAMLLLFLCQPLTSFSQEYSLVVHNTNRKNCAFQTCDIDSITFDKTENVPEEYFTPRNVEDYSNIRTTTCLQTGEFLKLPLNYIRKNTRITICVKGGNQKFKFGRGENTYQGYSVKIDSDSVYLFQFLSAENKIGSYRHGLHTKGTMTTVIDYSDGSMASLVIVDDHGELFSTGIRWWAGGSVYLQNEDEECLQANIIFNAKDIDCPVWFFSDSYFNWSDPARWPYYIYQQGYKNWLADHKPGEASDEAVKCLENDLRLGTPKYAVWCLGMNDPSDTHVPNATWLQGVERFLELCNEKDIKPVLTTIPSVPERNHKEKALWVRNSGYRYIDFAAAVESDDEGLWQNGMLSDDMVHPTQLGAKTLAEQVLKDFPEIELTQVKTITNYPHYAGMNKDSK